MNFYDVLLAKKLGGGGGGGSPFNFTGASGKLWGGMAKALVDGTYKSGTVTYTTAFPNTYTTLLDTGLTVLHGICMWVQDAIEPIASQQTCMYVAFSVNDDNTLNYLGVPIPTSSGVNLTAGARLIFPLSQDTMVEASGLHGALQINGGIVEYKGHYNKNANYQIFPINKTIEWIAW